MQLDIKQALTYPFHDKENIKKFALYALCTFCCCIPALNLFASLIIAGYAACNVNKRIGNRTCEMQEWDDIEKITITGILQILFVIIIALLMAISLSPALLLIGGSKSVFTTAVIISTIIILNTIILIYGMAAHLSFCKDLKFESYFKIEQIWRIISKNNFADFVQFNLILCFIFIIAFIPLIIALIATFGLGALFIGPYTSYMISDLCAQYIENIFKEE